MMIAVVKIGGLAHLVDSPCNEGSAETQENKARERIAHKAKPPNQTSDDQVRASGVVGAKNFNEIVDTLVHAKSEGVKRPQVPAFAETVLVGYFFGARTIFSLRLPS